jgi:hypothetical protein
MESIFPFLSNVSQVNSPNHDRIISVLLHDYLPVLPVTLVNLVALLRPASHHGPEVLVLLGFLLDLCLPFRLAGLLHTDENNVFILFHSSPF